MTLDWAVPGPSYTLFHPFGVWQVCLPLTSVRPVQRRTARMARTPWGSVPTGANASRRKVVLTRRPPGLGRTGTAHRRIGSLPGVCCELNSGSLLP